MSRHIVHAVLSLDVGGLERIVVALARERIRRDRRVTILCLDHRGSLAEEAEAAGVRVVSAEAKPGERAATVETLRSLQPDVLHTHQLGAAFHLAAVAPRVIHTEHGNPFARAGSLKEAMKLRLLMRRTMKRIDHFCCVSEEIADTMAKWWTVPRRKLLVVPNGIAFNSDSPHSAGGPPLFSPPCKGGAGGVLTSLRTLLGIPANAFVIGTVGRLHEVKRQDILLRAAALVPNAYVLLVGDGPELTALATLADELHLTQRVRFVGYQSQPEAYLQAMDVFALTSRSEGFPVSLLEAWATGKPVVCSAVGGLPKIVTDGVDGWLVPPGDVAGFAVAFGRVLANPEAAAAMGAAGRAKVVARYSLTRMVDVYEGLYE